MIPKTIHQIWVGDFKIPLREQSLIQKLKESHPDYNHILWTDDLFLKHRSSLNMTERAEAMYDYFYEKRQYVFCADILRIVLIDKFGGIYLDVDWDIKNKLDYFLSFDSVYFYHNDNDLTIPNNIFFAKENSDILKFCMDRIGETSWHGPSWFGQTIKQYFELPYEAIHENLRILLNDKNSLYYKYSDFENQYAKHLSLYSWEANKWEKLKEGQQL